MFVNSARVLPLILALTFLPAAAFASSCVTGQCHGTIMKFKYLHGPLAAEQQVGGGCASCHVSSGKACTATAKGAYTYVENKDKLCFVCHDKGDSPDHMGRTTNCIKCHNPHGSDKNMKLTRF